MVKTQDFKVKYDDDTSVYTLSKNSATALKTGIHSGGFWVLTATNAFLEKKKNPTLSTPDTIINYAVHDGVVDLQCWHEQFGHLCPQFVKRMTD